VIDCPFQLYGSADAQIETSDELLDELLIVKFNVAVESQPAALVKFAVYVPAAVIDWPFQLYGNAVVQIETSVELLVAFVIVKFKVAVESQPAALVKFAVYVPAEFMDWPTPQVVIQQQL
jgi:hypothetical protein